MEKSNSFVTTLIVLVFALTSAITFADGHGGYDHNYKTIGEVTALIPTASTSDEESELIDGMSGDTDFPFITAMSAIATVGEVDADTGMALTGYPDGHAAWLADEETVRVVYQSESYATMSSETYGWEMDSGVTFTGSHIHTIDYDRAGLAELLGSDMAASNIVKGSGKIFNTVFNVFGDEVVSKEEGGVWGNQTLADGTLVNFAPDFQLSEGDFFFQSFCGSFYEPANKYGPSIGFANSAWLTAEEWNIQRMFDVSNGDTTLSFASTNDTMGLAAIVVDIENETAYTVPALGQTGYEKLMPINPGHEDYVVIVLAGYNHGVGLAPLRLYVGVKGMNYDGTAIADDASERDQFLAANGLLYGKIYGMALANATFKQLGVEIDLDAEMLDIYLENADAPNTFDAMFIASSYSWGGWDNPVAVGQTEMALWSLAEEQPTDHTFFLAHTKTEHPAVDPDITKQRYFQNMTNKGGILAIDLEGLADMFAELDGALPTSFPANVTRTLAAVDGALTLDVGDKGVKHGGEGTAATWEDGTARAVAPDGLMWIKTADADLLVVEEDSGNDYGERKYALVLDSETMELAETGKGHFLAMAGGKFDPRAEAGAAAYPGTSSGATSSEFSGTWNITALLATKEDGSFYSMDELAGTGQQDINNMMSLADSTFLGVVQHRNESGGPVSEVKADNGGQIFIFSMDLGLE